MFTRMAVAIIHPVMLCQMTRFVQINVQPKEANIENDRPSKKGKPSSPRVVESSQHSRLYPISAHTASHRLDLLYHTISFALSGALQVVQLPEKLDRVLDVGTGTGIWAIDFAELVT